MSKDPTLVVICSWTGADIKFVQYYATAYQSLFPETPVMVMTTSPRDVLGFSRKKTKAQVAHALRIIGACGCDNNARAGILLHAFSSGGGYKACELARASSACGRPPPFSVQCLDSAPGRPRYVEDCRAVAKTLTRSPLMQRVCGALARVVLGALWARYHTYEAYENNPISKAYNDLLSEQYFQFGTRRCYMYSLQDDMVSYEDVKSHAAAAKSNYVVTEQVFDSDHVRHGKKHREVYWQVVHQTWTGLQTAKGVGPNEKQVIPLYDHGHGIHTSWPLDKTTEAA